MSCGIDKAVSTTKELVTILASADDEESLAKVGETLSEASSAHCAREDQVKTAIEKLQRLLTVEEKASTTINDEENIQRLDALKAEREATEKQLEVLECEFKNLEESVVGKERSVEEIQGRKANLSNSRDEVLPKSKYNFSLYTNITHIRWEYDGDDDQVKGFVSSLKDVKPFCLSSKQNSAFFIANYLWDLVDV